MDQDQSAPDPHAESEAVLELRKELEEKARRLHDSGLADYLVREQLKNFCYQQRSRCKRQQAMISNVGSSALIALLAGFCVAMLSEYPVSLLGAMVMAVAVCVLVFIGGKNIVIEDMFEEIERFAISHGLMDNKRTKF